MIGLADRVQPWARRFQLAPRTAATTDTNDDGDREERGTRTVADAAAPRFVRPALHDQER